MFLTSTPVTSALAAVADAVFAGTHRISLAVKPMSKHAKWYSPRLHRDLVTRLYFRAKAEGIPMTVLTNRLVEDGLSRIGFGSEEITTHVAEEPQPASVPG